MGLIVQKYGGTSVGTIERIKAVAAHIAATVRDGHQTVVVVSAMGEQTDELHRLALEISADPPRRELDMLLTVGERISMALVSIALNELGIRSISLTGSQSGILTDEYHGNARIKQILGDRIRKGVADGNVVIVAGFQGMSPITKEITTLGRGGSDLTAIAIAKTLMADRCEIYKDVDGICTADPRLVANARVVGELGWDALVELTWSGAAVLHARGAHLARKYEIPLEIRSSFNLDRRGTKVQGRQQLESVTISALAHKKSLSRLTVTYKADAHLLGVALDWLWQKGETPLMSQERREGDGRIILSQILSTNLCAAYVTHLKAVVAKEGGVWHADSRDDGLATATVVGDGFFQSPETVTQALAASGPVELVDTKNNAIHLCVREEQLADLLVKLHETFFPS